ncbi:MAG TPA: ribonuclease Z [Candidatus Nanoarchaeia archaeon]|nr:ribonuclease Z [Candidatus Nanoarchaeia archaeon]
MTSNIKLTFLGTADQIPSSDRNHTAILLTYEGDNILVDCGEGTQRQFRKAGLNPCKVTKILITHWHGDHVLGLPGLLSTLSLSGYNKKLYIYGPKGTKEFVMEMLRVFGFKKNYEIVAEEVSGKFYDNGDFYLEAESMEHGIPCNAYSFVKKGQIRIDKAKLKKLKIKEGPHLVELKKGKDISFNGKNYKAKDLTYKDEDRKISFVLDTRDNKKIIPFVKDADLLVCESSFEDGLKEQAHEHLHLTSTQAGEIAKKAKVKKLVLTHLSQRYEKNTKFILNEAKKVFKDTLVVKDFDSVSV